MKKSTKTIKKKKTVYKKPTKKTVKTSGVRG